eukprot:1492162-Prymnesium_polylepis.1
MASFGGFLQPWCALVVVAGAWTHLPGPRPRSKVVACTRSHPRIVLFPKSSSLWLGYGGQRRPAGPPSSTKGALRTAKR